MMYSVQRPNGASEWSLTLPPYELFVELFGSPTSWLCTWLGWLYSACKQVSLLVPLDGGERGN